MEPHLDLQPCLNFQAFIWRKFGLPVNVRAGYEHESFVWYVVSFGRCKSKLSLVSVGNFLQVTLGGQVVAFKVSLLHDRIFSFVVSSWQVGFQI
ncbi:hypothetical protein GQ55_6G180900 [Panicum hallii var. hallii]|uniref:Uncharacterized protein n=1 Tax=Panicum hallii var. hallii TaxID=1504633 RepID=A0A2T7D723_9POAL|nr:hypothetical protein GQ55_6G180900 [Panicum hallii var. hallii]